MPIYEEQWEAYRHTRNLWILTLVTFVPAALTAGALSSKVQGAFDVGFMVAGVWVLLFVYFGFRLNTWPCPRCGKWFSGTWWYNLGFWARKCVHCGLGKYANDDGSPPGG